MMTYDPLEVDIDPLDCPECIYNDKHGMCNIAVFSGGLLSDRVPCGTVIFNMDDLTCPKYTKETTVYG